jgi:DnaJ homolog subfamily C member 19
MAEFFRQMRQRQPESDAAKQQPVEEHAGPGGTSPRGMQPDANRTVREAADLLGVSLVASVDEVRRACRHKLVAERIHPDHGGDAEQTRQVIAARDLLIERIEVRS